MRIKFTSLLFLVACVSLAQVSYVVPPETRTVDPSDAPYGSWEKAATNIQTAIDAAVAQGWTNVWVSNGIYSLDQQIKIDNPMTLRSWKDGELDREGTIIDGNYPTKNIRCVYLNHAEAVARGFTIRNGYLSGYSVGGGAALYNNAVLDNCLITSNYAYDGGGVYVSAGLLTNCLVTTNKSTNGGGVQLGTGQSKASNCIISNNYASATGGGLYIRQGGIADNCSVLNNYADSQGGGAYMLADSLLTDSLIRGNSVKWDAGGVRLNAEGATVRRCVITENTSLRNAQGTPCRGGGGACVLPGALLEDSVISNNVVGGSGGGIAVSGGIVRHCLITDNQAGATEDYAGGGAIIYASGLFEACQFLRNRSNTGRGGGVLVWSASEDASAELRGCLLAANTAVLSGAGIHVYRGILELDNCTITDNHVTDSTSSTFAGGVYSGRTNHFRNTIIYGNTIAGSSTRPNIFLDYSATISTFTNCCVSPLQTGAKVINENSFADDPLLTEDYQLTLGSPCVNAGVYQDWMDDAKDVAGRSRLDRFSGIPDIGCFEYVPSGSMFRLR